MNLKYTVALLLIVVASTLADDSNKTEDEHKKTTTTPNPTTQEPTTMKPTTPPINTTVAPTTPPTPAPTTPSTPPPASPSTPPPTTPSTPPPTTPSTPPPTTPSTPPTNTTVAPTTPMPTTTAAPPSTDWIVRDGNGTVCIIASMNIKITVPYKSANNNKTVNAEFSLDNVKNATSTGQCGTSSDTLILTWENITSTFKFSKQNTSYHLSSIELNIPVNNHTFPNNTMVNASKITLKYDAKVFAAPVNHSYTCANVNLDVNGTSFNGTTPLNGTILGTLTISKVHVEAFGTGKDGKYSKSMDCSPAQTPDIVPIMVGLILAGLVVVVLIAYLVGRRRAQARGYLSM